MANAYRQALKILTEFDSFRKSDLQALVNTYVKHTSQIITSRIFYIIFQSKRPFDSEIQPLLTF
jgi:hypothetical protein